MLSLPLFLTGIVIFFTLLHFWIRFRRVGRYLAKIPGPPALPIIGNCLQFIKFGSDDTKLWYQVRRYNNEYYPIFRLFNGYIAAVNIRHPDHLEAVFSSMKHIEKAHMYDFLHVWFRTGLLTSTGKKWQERRKMLTPSFHFNVLQEFTNIFNENSQRLVEKLLKEVNDEPAVKELIGTFTDYTLNVICETAMGTGIHDKSEFQREYKNAVHKIGLVLASRFPRPWLHNDWMLSKLKAGKILQENLNYLHRFSNKIIEERKEYHEKTNGRYLTDHSSEQSNENHDGSYEIKRKRLAMLDLLIENFKMSKIDDEGIREEVDTFMFEGHDTTAMALCFIALLLAEHQGVQDRARAEIDQVFAESDGNLTINDYQKMIYLEMCIKECLRLYPSVPFIGRKLREDLQLKDYLIPKGVNLYIHTFDTHRDPNYWPDPLKFDPDRFLPENCIGRHPFQYVPFSGGPRNCIGQKFAMLEIKSLLSKILYNFHLDSIDIASEVQLRPDLVLRPNHPIHVKFVKRSRK